MKRRLRRITALSVASAAVFTLLAVGIWTGLEPTSGTPGTAFSGQARDSDPQHRRPVLTPAAETVADLIDLLPAPAGLTAAQPAGPLDPSAGRCGFDWPRPAALRQAAYTSKETPPVQIIAAAVRAYPAGMGAIATSDVRDLADRCPGAEVARTDLGFAAESFSVSLPATRTDLRPSQLVVVRAGDLVATVSVVPASEAGRDAAVSLARTWFAAWTPIVTVDVCPQQASTVVDAARNPDHADYAGGWARRDTITLDQAREASADLAGRILLRQTAGFDPAIVLPDAALPDPQVAPLPDFPDTLAVTLPADRPTQPTAPTFPRPPTTATTTPIVTADPIGPGCGWAFTGMDAPDATEATSPTTAARARLDAVADLVDARASWWVARYDYALDHAQFVADARAWNAWRATATEKIAAAWWKAYDSAYRSYLEDSVAYVSEYTAWQRCRTDCPAAPTAPVAPDEPTLPRP